MTARKRAASPYAAAVEQIVEDAFPNSSWRMSRAALRASILRLVARVEREAVDQTVKRIARQMGGDTVHP